ncbi:MAG: FprA family A-type flavoprotein [Clostridia bacterium]|nr:FprA family A-type flavoprotein [Clostridia bacterium]
MHCVKSVTPDLYYVGGSDRRAPLFEAAHPIPDGIAYNNYLLLDEKTVLMDTADRSVAELFFENVAHVLSGRKLDYIVVQHMEPDHSASLSRALALYPDAQVVCTAKAAAMIKQFTGTDISARARLVKEGDTLNCGRHTLKFMMAPMVHWPEVMVTFDETDRTLFSADAFGHFGALDGALFADEVDFFRDYLDEARRYYANIVGKYGTPVQGLLKKAAGLDAARICPLHGFLWRKDMDRLIAKYDLWSKYQPEEQGVLIACASVYGNTMNAAQAVAAKLRERGIKCVLRDVSAADPSYILAEVFKYSHLLLASPTYNNGVFVKMENLLHDIAAHTLANRTVFMIQNGSWAPNSAAGMKAILEGLKGFTFAEPVLTLKSALAPEQAGELDAFVQAICDSLGGNA